MKKDKRDKIAAQRERERAKKKPPNPPDCANCRQRVPVVTVKLRGIDLPVYSPRILDQLLIAFPELRSQVQPMKKLARAAGR